MIGRMARKILVAAALVVYTLAGIAAAAVAPTWVVPLLGLNTATLEKGQPGLWLLDSGEVTFIGDRRVRRRDRMVLRVLTPRGLDRAAVGYRYNSDLQKLIGARAWAISRDARRVKTYGTTDFSDIIAKRAMYTWDHERQLILHPSENVEVGGVFAWEIEMESRSDIFDLNWWVADDLPVVRSVFAVTPPAGRMLEWHQTSDFPTPVVGAADTPYRWEIRDRTLPIAAEVPLHFIPPHSHVSVRPRDPSPGAPLNSWAGMARFCDDIVAPRIEVTTEIRAKSEHLTRGLTERWSRIRALSEFVQRDVNYLSLTLDRDYLAGYRPHRTSEVLRDRLGDCKDKAALMVAMLRAIGENGYLALTFAGDPTRIDPSWPTVEFNHAIVAIPAEGALPEFWPAAEVPGLGRVVLFDPTDPYVPLGLLPGSDQGGTCLTVSPRTEEAIRIPYTEAAANKVAVTVDGMVTPTGDAEVQVRVCRAGEFGAEMHSCRQEDGEDSFRRLVDRRFSESFRSVESLHWTDRWQPRIAEWQCEGQLKARQFARQTPSTLVLVSAPSLAELPRLDTWRNQRAGKALVQAARFVVTIRLAIPSGWTVEENPEPVVNQGESSSFEARWRVDGLFLEFTCDYIRRGGLLSFDDYLVLQRREQALMDEARRPFILRKS